MQVLVSVEDTAVSKEFILCDSVRVRGCVYTISPQLRHNKDLQTNTRHTTFVSIDYNIWIFGRHLIAGCPIRVFGVTVAGLTATATCHVPGVGRTAVTVLTDHVREAVTLTAAAVTVTVARWWTAGGIAAQLITNTLCEQKPSSAFIKILVRI